MIAPTGTPPPFAGHSVLVHEGGMTLRSVAAAALASAGASGGIVVVAAAKHRSTVLEGLSELTDVDELVDADRLVVLDAEVALDGLMVDGSPHPIRFEEVIGSRVRRLSSRGNVVAFGEMVGVLWESGEVDAALRLEDLWNELGADVPLDLVCGYPTRSIASGPSGDVTARHDHHLHRAAFTMLPCTSESVPAARRFATATLLEWGLSDLVGDAQIVASELAANAVSHARTPLHIALQERDRAVRLMVGDQSPAPPKKRPRDVRAAGGRGLQLVAGVSIGWGHREVLDSKHVWADLELVRRAAGEGSADGHVRRS